MFSNLRQCFESMDCHSYDLFANTTPCEPRNIAPPEWTAKVLVLFFFFSRRNCLRFMFQNLLRLDIVQWNVHCFSVLVSWGKNYPTSPCYYIVFNFFHTSTHFLCVLFGRNISCWAFNAMHLTFVLKCDCRCSLVLVIFTCLLRNILLQDCPERSQDFRQAQCEKYNNIEFEGQYHEWLPFYGGTY